MATTNRITIAPYKLRWAFTRAGVNEENAVKRFPKLREWLLGEKLPTIKQLQEFAAKFYVPFGFLLLNTPPEESIPFPMFRRNMVSSGSFDLNVYDTVLSIQSRQGWLEDYLADNEIDGCNLVGTITLNTPVATAVNLLRRTLNLDPRWTLGLQNESVAINVLTDYIENAGVFVVFNGIVGNNTHRTLDVSSCQGFALVSHVAPFIFINSSDSKKAQMFTLVHEIAHIMLGESAGHAENIFFEGDNVEKFCDRIAAEFLVPGNVLTENWTKDFKKMSNKFKVSEIVIARRAHDLNLITEDEYRCFWADYNNRLSFVADKPKKSGGEFYRTSIKRIGKTFAIHLRNAVNNRQISYTYAYRLTGLYGKTFDKLISNI